MKTFEVLIGPSDDISMQSTEDIAADRFGVDDHGNLWFNDGSATNAMFAAGRWISVQGVSE
jgi:hypothetical protein